MEAKLTSQLSSALNGLAQGRGHALCAHIMLSVNFRPKWLLRLHSPGLITSTTTSLSLSGLDPRLSTDPQPAVSTSAPVLGFVPPARRYSTALTASVVLIGRSSCKNHTGDGSKMDCF